MSTAWIKKTLVFCLLVLLLACVFSPDVDFKIGLLDTKAALLVLVTPVLLVLLTQKQPLPWHLVREAFLGVDGERNQELLDVTQSIAMGSGAGRLVKMAESHSDPLVQYGASLLVSRFSPEETSELLARKIEAQDAQWNSLHSLCAFMAKMSPYFGMLATVVGLVQLLGRLEDFTKISGGMALAMQGTLFGLVSFTLLYAPLQRFLQSGREAAFQRNTAVARWFVLVARKADPVLIAEGLRALSRSGEKTVAAAVKVQEV